MTGIVGLLFVILASAASVGAAVPTAGPRLAISVRGTEDSAITVNSSGGDPQTLVDDPGYLTLGDRLSWAGDGSLLAFAASVPASGDPGGRYGTGWPIVAVAKGDGSGSRVFPRAFLNAGEPVISPDGSSVAFARARLVKVLPGRENYLFKGSIWSLDLSDGSVKQRTRWRLGFPPMPSSFSPDGSELAATAYSRRRGFEAVSINLRTGRSSPLAREASEPVYSPDGSQVAFIRWKNWRASGADNGLPPVDELRIARVGDVPRSRLLLRAHKLLAWPSWEPSGGRLVFTRSRVLENGFENAEEGDALMAINADGTCLTRVLSRPKLTIFGASWQPGPGREAGPISC